MRTREDIEREVRGKRSGYIHASSREEANLILETLAALGYYFSTHYAPGEVVIYFEHP